MEGAKLLHFASFLIISHNSATQHEEEGERHSIVLFAECNAVENILYN